MTQHQLDTAVALATGESPSVIRRRGFVIAARRLVEHPAVPPVRFQAEEAGVAVGFQPAEAVQTLLHDLAAANPCGYRVDPGKVPLPPGIPGEAAREIFFADDPDWLMVRRDAPARADYRKLAGDRDVERRDRAAGPRAGRPLREDLVLLPGLGTGLRALRVVPAAPARLSARPASFRARRRGRTPRRVWRWASTPLMLIRTSVGHFFPSVCG